MNKKNLRVVVFSDSHGEDDFMLEMLKYEQEEEGYDLAIHAGDYTTDVKVIQKHFDYFVPGNNDFDDLPRVQTFNLGKYKTMLLHGDSIGPYSKLRSKPFMLKYLKDSGYDIIIHGHTHIPIVAIDEEEDKYVLNPGSISLPRESSDRSYMVLVFENDELVDIQVKHLQPEW